MLNRFWQWTSAPAAGGDAESSIPHGPLRFRQWTSDNAPQQSTVIPHGPLRFRPWTSGPAVEPPTPEPPQQIIVGGVPFPRIGPIDLAQRIRLEDDEVIAVIMAWLHTRGTLQ